MKKRAASIMIAIMAIAGIVTGSVPTQVTPQALEEYSSIEGADAAQLRAPWYSTIATIKLDRYETKRLLSALVTGRNVSDTAMKICATTGMKGCSYWAAAISASLQLRYHQIEGCKNSRGVDIHFHKANPALWWCSGY